MSTPATFKVGDRCWHCNTHGGPSRPGDMQEERWLPAMEPCEVLTVSEPNKFGNLTYTIRRPDGTDRMVADSWLSPAKDVCPPYFDRTDMWPFGGALSLCNGSTLVGEGFFVAFRQRECDAPYALHSNTPIVPDDVERTFHARLHTLADLTYTLADVAKLRGIHSMDADDFARIVRGAVAEHTGAPAWVLDWAGVKEEDAKHFRKESAAASPAETAQSEAKAKVARKRAARLAEKTESEVAAETSPSPVECAEPAVVKESLMTGPTHFRGVLLRDASEWSDPSAEGVFVGVSNAAYHADKASLSASGLKTFLVSPADYRKEIYEPKGEVAPATQKAFDIGTMTHGFVLEGASLAAMGFALKPDGHNGSSTEGKAWTARMKAEGLRGVDSEMVKTAQELAAAIMADENLRFVGSRAGLSELSVRVRDPRSGAMLRARFDFAPEVGVWLWDIKSTSDADPVEFKKSFFDFGYDFQTVHYTAVAQLAGLPYKAMAFAAVGKPGAHDTALVKFGPMSECEEDWNNARRLVYQAWRDYADCVRTGVWKKRKFDPCIAVAREWQRNARVALIRDEEIPY